MRWEEASSVLGVGVGVGVTEEPGAFAVGAQAALKCMYAGWAGWGAGRAGQQEAPEFASSCGSRIHQQLQPPPAADQTAWLLQKQVLTLATEHGTNPPSMQPHPIAVKQQGLRPVDVAQCLRESRNPRFL